MNIEFYLSVFLGVMGIAGIFLAGKGHWEGWLLGFLVQPVWVAFAVVTEAWGLLPLPLGYAWVYGKNLLAWRSRTEPEEDLVTVDNVEIRPGEIAMDLRLAPAAHSIFTRISNYYPTDTYAPVLKEVNDMSLTKHGHGALIPEDDDLTKTAKTDDEKQVLAALAEENADADK